MVRAAPFALHEVCRVPFNEPDSLDRVGAKVSDRRRASAASVRAMLVVRATGAVLGDVRHVAMGVPGYAAVAFFVKAGLVFVFGYQTWDYPFLG